MRRSTNIIIIILLAVFYSTSLFAQHSQESYQKHFQTGLELFEKGLFSEAIPYFEEALSLAESEITTETADFYRIRSLMQIDPASADQHTDQFVQTYPGSNRAAVLLKERAHYLLEENNYAEAIRRMDRALNYPLSYNNRAELYYMVAETAAESGDYDLARRYFLELSNEHRRSAWSPRALYARGRLYLEEERYAESADAFELLRERHPQTAMARRIGTALGESYYKQRRFTEAIEALEDAIPFLDDENRTKAVYLIAESYNALNRFEEAARYYRHFLTRVDNPEEERLAYYGLGWVYHKQGIYHWAARAFGEAAIGDDDIARKALYYNAVNEKLAGRFRTSLDAFREFGDRFGPGTFYEEAHYEWAVTAMDAGNFVEAIDVLLPLARNFQDLARPAETLTLLGEAFYGNSEYSRAIEAFELAAEIDELDPMLKRQARFQRAWVLYFNMAYEDSQPEFEAVFNEAPNTDLGMEALFWSADANFQSGRYDRAASQFRQFIQRYPNHEMVAAAKYSLGWSYFMMGDFANATAPLIDFLENYEAPPIALFPYEIDTRLRIGDAFFGQGMYREAMEYYNATIGAEPGGDYAMYQVANSYYRMNRNFEAVTQFRRLLRIYPYSSLREQAQYNIAYIYLNTGNYDQAIEEFQTVIRRFPGTEWAARAQYNIGDSHYNAGNFEAAIEAYQRVLDEYPRSRYIIEAIDGIQFAQLSAGGDDTSTDLLEDFLADNPTSQTADRLRFRQAENVFQSGDYEAAVREFRQYLRITNNRNMMPEAYFNMADAYQRTSNKGGAIEAYETLINDFPGSDRAAPALAELGRLHYELGNYNESLLRFQDLAEKDAGYEQEAKLGKGNAYLALGNLTEARQQFEQVLSINSEHDGARVGLGKVLMRDGRIEEARRFFNLVAQSSTTEVGAEAQFLIGETYLTEGNRQSALEEFSRVRVLFEAYIDWVSEAQYKTAEIYIREGRRGDAISLLNSIVETYPNTPGATKARRLLQSN